MNLNKICEKEYYIVDCYDFVYFPRITHVVGVGASSCSEELQYYINVSDHNNKERLVYKSELERFKTLFKLISIPSIVLKYSSIFVNISSLKSIV